MIHIGKNTRSTIIAKGIAAGRSDSTYRGKVKVLGKADGARNHTQCDSLLIGDRCGAHTGPYLASRNSTARAESHASERSSAGEGGVRTCIFGERRAH